MDKEKKEIIKRLRGENTVQEVKITEIDLTYTNIIINRLYKYIISDN